MKTNYLQFNKIINSKSLWFMILIQLLFVGLTFYSEQSIESIFFNNFVRGYGSSNFIMRYLFPCISGYIAYSLYKQKLNINLKRGVINVITFNSLVILIPIIIYIISIITLDLVLADRIENSVPPISGPFSKVAENNGMQFIIILIFHYLLIFNLLVFFGYSLCLLLKEGNSFLVLILILLICNVRDFLPSVLNNSFSSSLLPLYPTDIVYFIKSPFKYFYDIILLISLTVIIFNIKKKNIHWNSEGSK